MLSRILLPLLASFTLLAAVPAGAAGGQQAEVEAAIAAAQSTQMSGPARIPLGGQATIDVPEGFAFIPQREAAALMHAMGNSTGEGFYGLVISDKMDGFVSVRFDASGYVKDDDAKDWNADELLQNLRDGTEATNEERRSRGIPEFTVAGWVEKPHYEAATHRLVWSAELRDKVPNPDRPVPGVNYNTYQLGREGYISMNLVTNRDQVEAQKPVARQLLAALEFNDGKRYADFNQSTDKVAAYGLAALVGGVAAKKLGLLAVILAFLAKFAKIGAVAAIGGFAVLRKVFGGKKTA